MLAVDSPRRVLTFIVGSLFYAVRRLSGALILCIFLHGSWDSATFLATPTHSRISAG